jgi:predicted transcriptional regulator
MEKLAKQLFEDADKRFIDKSELLEACLETLTEDQLFEMAIRYDYIKTEIEVDDHVENPDQSTPEKIIDAVLARYGE